MWLGGDLAVDAAARLCGVRRGGRLDGTGLRDEAIAALSVAG
jgi:hypothetical protein